MKYVITSKSKVVNGENVYRIKAVKSFGDVKEGDFGGYITKEINLSQRGLCWIYDDAVVCDNARVTNNAKIRGNARISQRAEVIGNAVVEGNAVVDSNAVVRDNAVVKGNAYVTNGSGVTDNAVVGGYATLYNDSVVSGAAYVHGTAHLHDKAKVYGNAEVYGYVNLLGNTFVFGNAKVYNKKNECRLDEYHLKDAVIASDAVVGCYQDFRVIKSYFCGGITYTWTKSNNKWAYLNEYHWAREVSSESYDVEELAKIFLEGNENNKELLAADIRGLALYTEEVAKFF